MTTRIRHSLIIATGTGAIGAALEQDTDVTATVLSGSTDLYIGPEATVNIAGCSYATSDIDGSLNPLAGDRAVWDAANHPTRHANDVDAAPTAIHHTLGTDENQAAAGNHTHTHDDLTGVTANQHHNQAHTLGAGGDHTDAPANVAHGFVKRNAANSGWEEVAYGSSANTVAEGNHTHGTGGHYRQFVYEISGGDFAFVIDSDGQPVLALQALEA